jgi:hypothetical protein
MKKILISIGFIICFSAIFAGDGLDRHQTIYAPFAIMGCDEMVVGELVVHVLEDTDIKNDGSVLYRYHVNLHGTGTGEISGSEYVFQHVINTNGHYESLPFIHSFGRTLNLIGKGQAPNLYVDCFFKMVINANGETTVYIDKLGQSECK